MKLIKMHLCSEQALPVDLAATELGSFGLSASGELYCGSHVLSTSCTSACFRNEGPGGAYLLYTTRANVLNLVSLTQLYDRLAAGKEIQEGGAGAPLTQGLLLNTGVGAGKKDNLYTAMHTAMRPDTQV